MISFSSSLPKSSDRMSESFVHVLPDKNTSVLSSAFYHSYFQSSFLEDSPSMRPAQKPYVKTECNNQIPISPQSSFLEDSLSMQPAQEPYVKTECNNQIPISPPLPDSLSRRLAQDSCPSSLLHTSTSSINLQLDTKYDEDEEEQAVLLAYDEDGYSCNSNVTNSSTTDFLVPPQHVERARDDTMVRDQPSRYVDYLSHNWEGEDIWSSWKHIVPKQSACGDTERLENALWRTWMKSRYRLRTVPPESLDWLKDCDVTWLYGPLQSSSDKLSIPPTSPAGTGISELHSLHNKKTILKKRSLLDIMLQHSLSASLSEQPQATNERRHIHFNDQVEQFTAVDVEDGGDDENGIESHANCDDDGDDDDDSSSDDGLMMKRSSKPTVKNQINRNSSQASFTAESRTIAVLPSTTLKYREDTHGLIEPTAKDGSGRISLSLSKENLQLSEPTTKVVFDSHNENAELSWKPSLVCANSKEVKGDRGEAHSDPPRTSGGIFILCGEGDDDVAASGLFRRIVEAVKTAKDIIYILRNVGWR